MGLISSMTRYIREKRLSKRLSLSKPSDEDSNDLINTTSETVAFAQAHSIESTTTIVHHSIPEPESPSDHKRPRPDLHTHTLFHEDHAHYASSGERVMQALSKAEYPVLKLDITSTAADNGPKKSLQAPLETGDRGKADSGTGNLLDSSRTSEKVGQNKIRSRNRRSIPGIWRMKTSLSLRLLRSPSSPQRLDAQCLADEAEEECLVDERENEMQIQSHRWRSGNRGFGLWTGDAMGRVW